MEIKFIVRINYSDLWKNFCLTSCWIPVENCFKCPDCNGCYLYFTGPDLLSLTLIKMIWANTLSSSLTQMESLPAILSLRMVSHVYKLLYMSKAVIKTSDFIIQSLLVLLAPNCFFMSIFVFLNLSCSPEHYVGAQLCHQTSEWVLCLPIKPIYIQFVSY